MTNCQKLEAIEGRCQKKQRLCYHKIVVPRLYREQSRVVDMVVATVMIGQFLDTAASINYSDDVAKAINFIGQRPGYGSSVPVTVTLLQLRIPLCSPFHDYAPDQALTPY
ncbi:hypothetical protein M0802_003002 [Mischocyttarus mexicanus]|nr:hypothetical protein M0802_003002 [Mischocyttarus mexicanus]